MKKKQPEIIRRNVFKRAYDNFNNWFFGVEEHRYANKCEDNDPECSQIDSEENHRSASVTPYAVYGREPDWTDRFTVAPAPIRTGEKLVAVMQLDMRAMYFHVATWLELVKPSFVWHLSATRHEDHNDDSWYSGVLLVAEEHFEETNDWFQSYIERIGSIDKIQPLPKLEGGMTFSGVTVNMTDALATRREILMPRDDIFEEWCWIIEHCGGKIYCTSDCWVFENNTDAVMFTLAKPRV
jgi:hypothetical protein